MNVSLHHTEALSVKCCPPDFQLSRVHLLCCFDKAQVQLIKGKQRALLAVALCSRQGTAFAVQGADIFPSRERNHSRILRN